MFLSQESSHNFPPIHPYPPAGDTYIKDTDLAVQNHLQCPGSHGLRFLSITWNCVGDRTEIQTAASPSIVSRIRHIDNVQDEDAKVERDYGCLDRERDLSAGVTRNLFSWMRDESGFTAAERDIYRHEWIDALDSDDESIHPEGDGWFNKRDDQ